MSMNNITPLFHSKSQNKYDLNNIELSLTNSIDNSDFVLLKNGTIKKKRKKNSYLEGYLDNKRLNKAISNSNKKRNKSCSNIKTKTNLFYKTNFDGLKHSINSDKNIFNKVQKINIFENVIINTENNNSLKLSYSYNDNNINNIIGNKKEKGKYNEMMDIKRKKLDKYENLIKTKNMYKDLWKNLKNKNMKKNIKNKNNPNKKNIQKQLDYTFKEEELKDKIKYDKNNLTITKNDGIEYNPLIDNKKIRNKSEIMDKTNKTLKLNLNNLIIFKRQKEYKHYDYLGNNYNYYERNESSGRKKIKNENNNEYINIINRIKNEENKYNMRNTYNLKYGYAPEYNIINTNEYGNHKVYVSNNVNYEKGTKISHRWNELFFESAMSPEFIIYGVINGKKLEFNMDDLLLEGEHIKMSENLKNSFWIMDYYYDYIYKQNDDFLFTKEKYWTDKEMLRGLK